MDRYANHNAILIGTIAKKILIGKPQISSYFVDFLQKPDLCGEINTSYVQVVSSTSFIVSGVYTFAYREKSKRVIVPARYSFVFVLEHGKWKILNHHSSKIPKGD
tara:strand:+ start:2031 stop:2345 length:315 start_codon:yes stop_codon:yes gene_type:complete